MKGVLFTEFLEYVEEDYGDAVLDEMLTLSKDEGIYTSVGSYDHKALIRMVVSLSTICARSAAVIQQEFGARIFPVLYSSIPPGAGQEHCHTSFRFIRHVEDYIHVEVRKLYPDSNPPQFKIIEESEHRLVFDYFSSRCLSHVCYGLIQGCAKYFDEQVNIVMAPVGTQDSPVRFTVDLLTE
jgi:hypothetical protein